LNFTGLSLDQAPPISIPLRFFLVAPLFAIIAAVLLFVSGVENFSRFAPEVIAATHLITIGFFGFVMLGALTQMLPVIANATIKKVDKVAGASHLFIILGVLDMVYGFLEQNQTALIVAYGFLGSGFLLMVLSILNSISAITNFTPTIKAMINSLSFAFIVVLLGVFLLYEYANNSVSSVHISIANIHAALAIFGFAGILILGVVFQVLPMFYVASSFGKFFENKLVYIIGFGLLLWSITNLFFPHFVLLAKLYIALSFTVVGVGIWKKFDTRRRKVKDITVFYYRSGVIFLISGLLLWVLNDFTKYDFLLGSAVLTGSFILSIMQAMLYKIIPFLVWFHLNAKGYMSIPTMNEMIDKRLSNTQYILFVGAVVLFVCSFYVAILFYVSLLFFILSMIILEYNIIIPVTIYKKTIQTKPDFDMSAFKS